MAQVLAFGYKIDISNCAQFVFVALGAIIDNFEFELWMPIPVVLAPSLKISREFVVRHLHVVQKSEIVQVQLQRAIGLYVHQIVENLLGVDRPSIRRKAHHLVLARVHLEAGELGKCRVQKTK